MKKINPNNTDEIIVNVENLLKLFKQEINTKGAII